MRTTPSRWYTPWLAGISGFVLTAALQATPYWPQSSEAPVVTITLER